MQEMQQKWLRYVERVTVKSAVQASMRKTDVVCGGCHHGGYDYDFT